MTAADAALADVPAFDDIAELVAGRLADAAAAIPREVEAAAQAAVALAMNPPESSPATGMATSTEPDVIRARGPASRDAARSTPGNGST